jgi:hypothetical protein
MKTINEAAVSPKLAGVRGKPTVLFPAGQLLTLAVKLIDQQISHPKSCLIDRIHDGSECRVTLAVTNQGQFQGFSDIKNRHRLEHFVQYEVLL